MKNSLNSLYIENGVTKEHRSSLNYVILAITFGMVFLNVTGGPALTGFARELQAKEFVFGILMALPVIGGLFQLFASFLLERTRQRKKIFLVFGVIQRSLWIPVALVPYIFPMSLGPLRIWSVIVLITLASSCGSFVNVSFFSWMADLIPGKFRGRFFSLRTRISTISGLAAGLIIAKLLDLLPGFAGYTVVFIIAGVCGVADILCFIKVASIPMDVQEKKEPMSTIVRQAFRDHKFCRYIIFWTVWGFGINFASPFINLYALSNLKMSFTEITLTGQIVCNITTIFFITKWGRFLDKFGSKILLFFTCIITSILPVLLIFASSSNYIPFLIFNFVGGMIWCGTDLAGQNMLITHTPSKNRSLYIAIYSVITTFFGNALAYIVGGYFLEYVNNIALQISLGAKVLNNYEMLFIVASILRLAAVLIFLPGVPEEGSPDFTAIHSKTVSWIRYRWMRISRMG